MLEEPKSIHIISLFFFLMHLKTEQIRTCNSVFHVVHDNKDTKRLVPFLNVYIQSLDGLQTQTVHLVRFI